MATQSKEPVLTYLGALKCSSPMFPNNINLLVSIQENATFPELFKKLIENKILSIPVVNKEGKALSIVSMVDLLGEIVEAFSEKELSGLHTTKTWEYFFHLIALKEKKTEITEEKVSQLLEKSISMLVRDPVPTITDDETILSATKQMLTNNAHRVLVTTKQGELSNVISQSRILEFFGQILSSIPEANKTIEELNLGEKEVVTIEEHRMVIEAFKKMKQYRVSAVGVVNADGELVGTVSVNDLKLLGFDLKYFEFLDASTKDYIEMVNKADKLKNTNAIRSDALKVELGDAAPVIAKCRTDTLGTIIQTMNSFHIHRVFITQDKKPVGVVSQLDVIKAILAPRIASHE